MRVFGKPEQIKMARDHGVFFERPDSRSKVLLWDPAIKRLDNPISNGTRVTRLDQIAVAPILQNFAWPSWAVCRDWGAAAHHCFHQDVWQALYMGRKRKDVCLRKKL